MHERIRTALHGSNVSGDRHAIRTRGGGLLQDDTDEMEPRRQRPTSMSSVRRFSGALSDLPRTQAEMSIGTRALIAHYGAGCDITRTCLSRTCK